MVKFLKSFAYAFTGIRVAIREQRNLKIQISAAVIVIVGGLYFRITCLEWAVLLLSIGLVLSLELVNTAIENMVDLITVERTLLAGKIKDVAAGAVLIASFIALLTGCLIFAPYLIAL